MKHTILIRLWAVILAMAFLICADVCKGQTVLGKHPADTMTPGFFSQNDNANALLRGLSASGTEALTLGGGLTLGGQTQTAWTTFNGRRGAITLTGADVTAAVPTLVDAAALNSASNVLQGQIGGGVSLFNGRSGPVSLTYADVTTAAPTLVTASTLNSVSNLLQGQIGSGGGGVAGVSTFNGRAGPVSLTSSDITTAAPTLVDSTYVSGATNPLATKAYLNTVSNLLQGQIIGGVAGVSLFNGRAGPVTLTSGDITTALPTVADQSYVNSATNPLTTKAYLNTVSNVLQGQIVSGTAGVALFNGRSGSVNLTAADVTNAAVYMATTQYVATAVATANNGVTLAAGPGIDIGTNGVVSAAGYLSQWVGVPLTNVQQDQWDTYHTNDPVWMFDVSVFTISGSFGAVNGNVDGTFRVNPAAAPYQGYPVWTNASDATVGALCNGSRMYITNSVTAQIGPGHYGAYYCPTPTLHTVQDTIGAAWLNGQGSHETITGMASSGGNGWITVVDHSHFDARQRPCVEIFPDRHYRDTNGTCIWVTNSTTAGFNEALSCLYLNLPSYGGANPQGGRLKVAPGTYYITNTIFASVPGASATFPWSGGISIDGPGEESAAIVYVGAAGTNALYFAGWGRFEMNNIAISTTADSMTAIVQGYSSGVDIHNVLIGPWGMLNRGSFDTSEFGPQGVTPQGAYHNLIGLQVWGRGPMKFSNVTFQSCDTGIESNCDDISTYNVVFHNCGRLTLGANSWPVTSPHWLGGGMVLQPSIGAPGWLESTWNIQHSHFTALGNYFFNCAPWYIDALGTTSAGARCSYNDCSVGSDGTRPTVVTTGGIFKIINPQDHGSGFGSPNIGNYYLVNPSDYSTWATTPAASSVCSTVDLTKGITITQWVQTNATGPQGLIFTNVSGLLMGIGKY